MKPKSMSFATALFVCVSLAATPSATAAKTWTGSASGDWANTVNWLEGALPGTTETVIFNASSTGTLTLTLGADRTIRGIDLTNPAGGVTISAGSKLFIGTAGINLASATADLNLLPVNVILRSGNYLFNPPTGRTLSFAAVPHRNSPANANGGGNNDNVGGHVKVAGAGTVKIGTTERAIIFDEGSNPFVTMGDSDWAATDATGNVIAASYVDWNANIGTNFIGNANVTNSFTQTGNGGTNSIRFADSETAHVVTLNNPTFTGRGVLVTPDCAGGTITGGFFRPNRVSTAGATMSIVQNSTVGDLVIGSNISNASSSTPVSLVKTGPGRVVFTANSSYTGRLFIHAGVAQFGSGGTTGSPGAIASVINDASLVFNRSDTFNFAPNISGTGSFTQAGPGTLNLTTSVSTFTGPVLVTGGTLGVTSLANLGSGTQIQIDNATLLFLGAFDPTSRAVTLGSNGATFDTNGQNVTFASAFVSGSGGTLAKTGAGTLNLAASNNFTGGTVIHAGTLLAEAASATGSGPVTVNNGSTLGGSGSAPGAVSVAAGGTVAPGASVGTLTVGSLDLAAGSALAFEFNSNPANDQIAVSTAGGLAINGGAITLLQENSATPFAAAGTYNLISYSGSIGGTGISALSVANPQAGFGYTFGESGGFVTLTIAPTGVVSQWITDGDGSWTTPGNWSSTIPNQAGATANFTTSLSNPSIVTLDGAKTVGALVFTSTNGYTIAQGSGGTLTLNNNSDPAAIAINDGLHTVSAPLNLVSNTEVSFFDAIDGLVLGGLVSGSAGLSAGGPGTLSLLGANSGWSGAVSVSGSTLSFANEGLGTGNLSLADATLEWLDGNTQDISNRIVSLASGNVVFNTGANHITLANAVGNSGSAAFAKQGSGTLTLAGNNSFTGSITIAAGQLRVGNGGTTGSVVGNIVNNSELAIHRSDSVIFDNLISGTGNLIKLGTGDLDLGVANTFSGTTSIASGNILLTDPLALQNSTLLYSSTGGAIGFNLLTTATFGALSGDKNLLLENLNNAPVALSVGGNGTDTTYSGSLSGSGSLTKTGTGRMTLDKIHAFTGTTAVNGGILELGFGSSILTSPAVSTGGSGRIHLTGGALGAPAATFAVGSAGLLVEDGNVTVNGTVFAHGSSGTSASAPLLVTGGQFSAADIVLGRTGANINTTNTPAGPVEAPANTNLYINGGEVNVSGNLYIGTYNTQPNSTVVTRVDQGSLTVGGAVSIGLNNGDRWSILDINGGEFTSSGDQANTGVVLGGASQGRSAFIVRGSGLASAQRIQLGRDAIAGTGRVTINGGELYVGAGGMVLGSTAESFIPQILLQSGRLGATANWTTSIPVALPSTPLVSFEVHTANTGGTPFDITMTGPLSGTGSLLKTGGGTLTLGGGHTHTGETRVEQGVLRVQTATFDDNAVLFIESGAQIHLDFAGGDRVAAFYIDGTPVADGIWGAIGSGAPNVTATLTGSGLLYVNTAVGGTPYQNWAAGTFAKPFTQTNPGDNPDGDGLANLLEFVLGGDPTISQPDTAPKAVSSGTNLVITFKRSDESELDPAVTARVQVTTNLATWNPANDIVIGATNGSGPNGATYTVSENGLAPDDITVSIPKGSNAKLFARVIAEN
jgi:autotransporter-associated beta strand protein